MEKQRLTFMCCSNASGAHKLKLLVIGKSKNPRCFKNFTCPVNYKCSKSAWMTSTIFYDWFHQCFVKEVTEFLTRKKLPVKALLLIDNAPSHPPETQLISAGGTICAMFLPPNVTFLIQPMDQNIFKITKLHYRNSLLAVIAGKQTDLLDSIKMLSIKDGINLLDSAWNQISQEILHNCWKNILNLFSDQDDPDDNIPLSVLRERFSPPDIIHLEETATRLLQALNPQIEVTLSTVKDWNNNPEENRIDVENLEIHDDTDDDDLLIYQPQIKVSPKDALEALDKALIWAENEMVDQSEISVLRKLKEKALLKMVVQKTCQKKMTDFFL